MNVMKALTTCKVGGKVIRQIESFEGNAFEHNGIALHIRKVGCSWMISLFNSGLITRGIANTIKKAVELFDSEEGRVIADWNYIRSGAQRLKDLHDLNIEENTEQLIDKTYDPNTGRLVIGKQVKAGDLI